jgi:hypothetical protein
LDVLAGQLHLFGVRGAPPQKRLDGALLGRCILHEYAVLLAGYADEIVA